MLQTKFSQRNQIDTVLGMTPAQKCTAVFGSPQAQYFKKNHKKKTF